MGAINNNSRESKLISDNFKYNKKSTKDWELTSWVDFFGIRRIT